MLWVRLESRLARFELGSKIMYARVDAMELSFEEGVGVPCNKEMRPGDTGGRGGLTWQEHCEFVVSF